MLRGIKSLFYTYSDFMTTSNTELEKSLIAIRQQRIEIRRAEYLPDLKEWLYKLYVNNEYISNSTSISDLSAEAQELKEFRTNLTKMVYSENISNTERTLMGIIK